MMACPFCSVKDIEHERTWLNGSIFEVEVRVSECTGTM